MNRIAWFATAVVALNLVIATIHGLAHSHAQVGLEPWQLAFVQVTVYALPILAAILYWTPQRRVGAALLAATMLAALLFGIYFHFIAETTDHVAYRDASGAGMLFIVTAVLLVPAEGFGVWFGARTWSRLRQSI